MNPGRLALFVGILVAGAFFWDSAVLLPFKLLAVMGHETGHALAALIVGGSVDSVSLGLDQGGQCLSRIPEGFFAKVIVFSAGYVGSAIISVLLLVASFRFDARRAMLGAACVWLALMGVFYARDAFTLAFSIGMAVAFGLGAKFLPKDVVGGLNVFIASFTALYAVMDLKDDLWNSAVRAHSDAQLLADVTIVPAIVWAVLWSVLSVAILIAGAWQALKAKPQLSGARLNDHAAQRVAG
ncbi:MAG: M50 family metallopeptidase [Archangium sp.]